MSTRWTGELARIVLQDAAHLQEEEELTGWLRPVPVPGTGYLVHGEVAAANAMARRLGDELGRNAVVPTQGERVRVGR